MTHPTRAGVPTPRAPLDKRPPRPRTYLLRRTLTPTALLLTLLTAAGLTAAGYGAGPGPRWLLLTGLAVTAPVLTLVGHLAEAAPYGTRATAGPRSGAAAEWAPALVHEAATVHRRTGTPVAEHDPEAVHVFDLSVITADGRPHRTRVRQAADVQGLARATTAVVRYDVGRPWRLGLPAAPPGEWRARAARLAPVPPAVSRRPDGRPVRPPAPHVRAVPPAFLSATAGAALAALAVVTLLLTR
ncbi:hypothetical protein ACQYWQ_25695 [Streptomyces sp. P6-2-1]|uniref:hypothetical protein n=1 Tax=Streptomyces sp. P6-2-1 TaxID=3422591 RepID=UPI003D36B1CA